MKNPIKNKLLLLIKVLCFGVLTLNSVVLVGCSTTTSSKTKEKEVEETSKTEDPTKGTATNGTNTGTTGGSNTGSGTSTGTGGSGSGTDTGTGSGGSQKNYEGAGANINNSKPWGSDRFKIKNEHHSIKIYDSIDLVEESITPTPLQNNSQLLEKADGDPNNKYFFGTKGLEALKKKIQDELPAGPEIFGLKGIILGQANQKDPFSGGLYNKQSKYIWVNIQNYYNKFWMFFENKKINTIIPTGKYPQGALDLIMEVKVDYIYQIILHEYFHHLAHTYFTKPLLDSDKDQSIYTFLRDPKVARSFETWDKTFLNEFKSILKYNNETHRPSSNPTPVENAHWVQDLYTQQELFEIANGPKYPDYTINKNVNGTNPHLLYGYLNPQTNKIAKSYTFNTYKQKDVEMLAYYYNIDELVARKYGLIFAKYFEKNFQRSLEGSNDYLRIEYIHNEINYFTGWSGRQFLKTPAASDVKFFQEKYDSTSTFFNDTPFAQPAIGIGSAEKLYDNLADSVGTEQVDKSNSLNVSYIMGMDNFDIYINDWRNYSNIEKTDSDIVRIGGYLNQDMFNQLVTPSTLANSFALGTAELGYHDNQGVYKKLAPVSVYRYNSAYKQGLQDHLASTEGLNGAKYFWVINDGDVNNWNYQIKGKTFDNDDYLNLQNYPDLINNNYALKLQKTNNPQMHFMINSSSKNANSFINFYYNYVPNLGGKVSIYELENKNKGGVSINQYH